MGWVLELWLGGEFRCSILSGRIASCHCGKIWVRLPRVRGDSNPGDGSCSEGGAPPAADAGLGKVDDCGGTGAGDIAGEGCALNVGWCCLCVCTILPVLSELSKFSTA